MQALGCEVGIVHGRLQSTNFPLQPIPRHPDIAVSAHSDMCDAAWLGCAVTLLTQAMQ